MKVVAIVDERKTGIREIDKPVPGSKEILVHIKACALCTFEQRVFTREVKYPLPWVGGHEYAGIIEEIGPDVDPKRYRIGAKVAPRGLKICGECYYCRHGMENMCENAYNLSKGNAGKLVPGGLGEYIICKPSEIFFMDDKIGFESAVFAEPLGCVVNSITQGRVEMGSDVVIIGGGVMGMLHILCAKLSGARAILSEPDPKRAEFAKKIGADIVINPKASDPVEAVKEITGGYGAKSVFNTTPIAALVEQGIKMTAEAGTFVQYSSMHPDAPVPFSPNWLHNSQTVLTGTKSPSVVAFDTSVRLISKGLINVAPLMSEVYDMTEADKAFERALSPETFRVMIRF